MKKLLVITIILALMVPTTAFATLTDIQYEDELDTRQDKVDAWKSIIASYPKNNVPMGFEYSLQFAKDIRNTLKNGDYTIPITF